MRDFPLFDTANGVGSIILKEVPYSGAAYIRMQSASDPGAFLKECLDFCVAVGAQKVFASGHDILAGYPLHTSIMEMRCCIDSLPDTDAALFPLQENTLEYWRTLYNEKMAPIDNATYMTARDGEKLLKKGSGYFVHRGEELLGIGIASEDRIDAVISNIPGCGREVLLALCHALSGETVRLEVASSNARAIRLYERLGFLVTGEISTWYKIF